MISHKHRCVFVHIPKCAGQSIVTAFLDDLGLTWETRDKLLLRKNDDPEQGPPRLAHLTASDYVNCGHMQMDQFAEYFSFAVVRNPWARVVSFYRYFDFNETFTDFVNHRVSASLADKSDDFWFLRPQMDYLVDSERKIIVKRIVAFESLTSEWESIATAAGLESPLRHINKSEPGQVRRERGEDRTATAEALLSARVGLSQVKRQLKIDKRSTNQSWLEFYDDATWLRVADLYAEDIEVLGYAGESRFEASD